ncbi:MAG: cation diffusion facilitator family transporter [Methylococcaceae bacterium]|jgi:cobalt-zinc-cadmium efflux system protein|nr:cation diffusion facilitator family transporter [Methylococcaceae bacterium]MDD1635444.1 cation diffusion facilitator family transporter [Methylococcaceae bacterium]
MTDHHNHNHSKGHHHHPSPKSQGRVFIMTIVLNMLFVIIEFAYGFITNSTALIADAGHNISDVLGLMLAWGAVILTRKAPSKRYTYGLRSTSIMAAVANAMLLLVACGAIAMEAIDRFSQPPAVAGLTVSIVAAVGIVINGLSAWLLMRGSKEDLNIRGAYLHMAADAAVSLAVVIAGVAMFYTGWFMIDPIISLVIVIVIVVGTWSLLRDSMQLALSAVPANIDALAIDAYLRQLAGVTEIHDLHIWGLSTTESALTVHLVMPNGHPGDNFMDEIVQTLEERFFVHHSTLQIEQGTTNHSCSLSATRQLRHHH